MYRTIFFICLLFLNTKLVAESAGSIQEIFQQVKHSSYDWSEIDKKRDLKQLKKIIINNNLNFDCIFRNNKIDFVKFKDLHLVDLNQDGELDLVYSGWCKPYPETHFYLKKKDRYIPTLKIGGFILDVSFKDKYSEVIIKHEAIGCLSENIITSWGVKKKSKTIKKKTSLCWNAEAVLPLENIYPQKRVTQGKIVLRTNHIVDNKIRKDPCKEGQFKGNISAEFKAGVVVWVISSYKDKSGVKWSFVVVPPNSMFIERNYYNIECTTKEKFMMGWVKSESLKLGVIK